MATNANEILDRLAALLDAATPGPWMGDWCITTEEGDVIARTDVSLASDPNLSDADGPMIVAIRNAAPALIRLARAVLAVDDWFDKDDYTLKLAHDERAAAIKALGEVRL